LSKNAEPKPLYGTSQVITKTSWLGNWAVRKKESDCTFILLAIRAHCSFTVGGAFPKEGT